MYMSKLFLKINMSNFEMRVLIEFRSSKLPIIATRLDDCEKFVYGLKMLTVSLIYQEESLRPL